MVASRAHAEKTLAIWFSVTAGVMAVFLALGRIEDGQIALVLWGSFLLVLGIGHSVLLWRHARGLDFLPWWLGHSLSAMVMGSFTITFSQTASAGLLLWTIAVWAFLAGASNLFLSFRRFDDHQTRRDWRVLGVITLLLSLATLVEPVDVLWLMGTAGAWAAIVAVFSAISAVHQASENMPAETRGA